MCAIPPRALRTKSVNRLQSYQRVLTPIDLPLIASTPVCWRRCSHKYTPLTVLYRSAITETGEQIQLAYKEIVEQQQNTHTTIHENKVASLATDTATVGVALLALVDSHRMVSYVNRQDVQV